ncbi:lysozyme [Waterburya agarophytonicola]|uniref:lysozyme n=1 Tax=Waterburya agarophytonicola TaxID=2886916 RepID=UPI001E47952D|nr:lysozyme [Waterburya agarophytonicola]
MHKYFDSAIALTSICSIGLATLTLAEDTIAYEQPDTVKDLQLQRLDNSLAANIKSLKEVEPLVPPEPAPQPISIAAINTIKEFEGFESQAYIDTDGTPVIGYGLSAIGGVPVQIGDRIDSNEADAALHAQLQVIQQKLDKAISVDLSDRQLGAIASLAFNAGVDSIEKSSLVRKINAGDYHGAADEFLRWDKANVRGILVQLPGLTRRRQAERQLFLLDS